VKNLKEALKCIIDDSVLVRPLAEILDLVCSKGMVTYGQIKEVGGADTDELLLLAYELRLIIPVKTLRTSAWEDRLLEFINGALYEVPNIIRHLVTNAKNTGCWDPGGAIEKIFEDMDVEESTRITYLVEELCRLSECHKISAWQIKKACRELKLSRSPDTLIADLKAAGIISPKLKVISEVRRARAPLYEISPVLCV